MELQSPARTPTRGINSPSRVSTLSPSPSHGAAKPLSRRSSFTGASSIRPRSFSVDSSIDGTAITRLKTYLRTSMTHEAASLLSTHKRQSAIPEKTKQEKWKELVANKECARSRELQARKQSNELQRVFRQEARRATGKPLVPPHAHGAPAMAGVTRLSALANRSVSGHRDPTSPLIGASASTMAPLPTVEALAEIHWRRATEAYRDLSGPQLLRQSTVDAYFSVPAFMRPLLDTVGGGAASSPVAERQFQSAVDADRHRRWTEDSDVAFRRARLQF
jgi:hypothetical protein